MKATITQYTQANILKTVLDRHTITIGMCGVIPDGGIQIGGIPLGGVLTGSEFQLAE